MKNDKRIPERLYKHRDFSHRTLDMIISDNVYYADPSTFNDPLDSRPSLKTDLGEAKLEDVLRNFVERRTSAEMGAAAEAIKSRGTKTMDHIKRHSRLQADELMADLRYHATDPDYEEYNIENPLCMLLGYRIEEELLRQYDKGIVSLAERDNCLLMWSHYGDQHRGVCIGYSVPDTAADSLHKVEYGGSRLVEASKVAAMLEGNDAARAQVDEAVLLRKAPSWSYEREWRLIGHRGLHHSPLELEEIIFGMRCLGSVKYAVMKALADRERRVKFYEMREVAGTFELEKRDLNENDELFVHFPRCNLATFQRLNDLRSAAS